MSTYSTSLKIELITTGTQAGSWGDTTNTNLGTALEQAIVGKADIDMNSTTVTLTLTNTNAAQDARAFYLNLTGTPGGAAVLEVPAVQKPYIVKNGSNQVVTVKVSGQTGVAVPVNATMWLYNNGTDVTNAITNLPSGATVGGTAISTTTGGIGFVYETSNYTTKNNEGVLADTSGGAFTVTLPATPATGDQVVVADPTGDWGTNNLTVGRNGSTISGVADDLVCDISGAFVQLVYSGTTWAVYAQVGGNGGTVVTLDGTQTLTNKTLTDPAIIGTILEDVYTISDGAAFEVDPGNGSVQLITLGASRTPKATNFAAGEAITLMVDDGTNHTITWTDATWGSGGVVWLTDGGVAPTLATTGYTAIVLWKVSTQVYGARVGDNA